MAKINSFKNMEEQIEKLRETDAEDIKEWLPTGCIVEICNILGSMIFERNGPKLWSQSRMKIRRVLNKYDLERTRIKCDRDNNSIHSPKLKLEIHRPAANDDDYMKFELKGVRGR